MSTNDRAMVRARYGLAHHVFVCSSEEYVVVLDLKQDRYFTLDAGRTAALGPVLTGWPAPAAGTDSGPNSSAGPELTVAEAAEPLLRQGWLLEVPAAAAKEATPVRAPPVATELLSGVEGESGRIDARALLTFVLASVLAKFALRFWRFDRVIRRVAARKAARPSTAAPFDLARARQLVEVFGRLRVFLFSHQEKCLQDSLALLEFLAPYGIFPDWVFGVRARPFVAHCWVQYEDLVCNDTVEHVTSYTTIMVV